MTATGILAIVSRAKAREQRIPRYFTGNPCKHGHLSERLTSTANCVECLGIRNRLPETKAAIAACAARPAAKSASRQRSAQYHQKNRDAVLAKMKVRNAAYYLANRDAIIAKSGEYQRDNQASRNAYKSAWQAAKKHRDPQFAALLTMRRLVARTCERIKANRKQLGRTVAILGYNANEFRIHIERQFLPGMSWGNHGDWHVDHIHPLSRYDLTQPGERAAANSLSNLRPLWAVDNMKKSDEVQSLL
jgi:hypothetical protein